MHCSPYISMTHCANDRSEVSSARKNPSAVAMSCAVQPQFLRRSCPISGLPKQVADRLLVSRCGSLRRKDPTAVFVLQRFFRISRVRRLIGASLRASGFCCPEQKSSGCSHPDYRCGSGRAPVRSSSPYRALSPRRRKRVLWYVPAICVE